MQDSKLLEECNNLFYIEDSKLYRKITTAPNALADSEAGWLDGEYRRVRVNKKPYLVHRIMFLMIHKYLPKVVDHVNGKTLDNSVNNLRESDKMQNRWNCIGNSGTQTGVKGVYLDRGRFKAMVNFKGSRYYLGMYGTLEEAKKVVDRKYIELQQEFSMQKSRKE